MRFNLRKLRFGLILYVLFDLYIGGHCAGFFPLAELAAAQFTTVTGTVTDPNGLPYAFGTISAGLVLPGGTSPTLNGLPYTPPSQPTGLDANGNFTVQLADNTVLLPAATKWTFLICSALGSVPPAGGKGPVCFNVPAQTISGSSQNITASITAVALALGTSGAGTIAANNGSAGAIVNYPAAGGSRNISPDASLTDSGGTLAYTGTKINAPNFSPTTNTDTPVFSNLAATTGIGFANNSTIDLFATSTAVVRVTGTGLSMTSPSVLAWGLFPSPGSGISVEGGSIIALGNGTGSDESDFLRSANSCRPTTAITLSTSPTTVCTWSLPALAKTWSWSCSGIYSLTAGTTPTLIIGMNASQAPTSETGSASILSTLTGTSTQATVTSTSSGNVNILTGATNTQANAQFTTFGTIQASGTAGTFAITATMGGTTPAGTVNVGTVCSLF